MRGQLTPAQTLTLLNPIKRNRVLTDGKGHSHVSQQDITAHLIRMFGFGGFDTEILSLDVVFERERSDAKTGSLTDRWDVCYRATLRLTIYSEDGLEVAHYEDGSTGLAQNQTRGDGHDLAMKSAISLAKKRCAINLGDQFGLSLYNKGQLSALVIATLVRGPEQVEGDVQDRVPDQVSLGNDEIDRSETPQPPADWRSKIAAYRTEPALEDYFNEAKEAGWATPEVMAAFNVQRERIEEGSHAAQ